MFLNEVALGKEHTITNDDWRLTKAPPGYDCIVARGRTEPSKIYLLHEISKKKGGRENTMDRVICNQS